MKKTALFFRGLIAVLGTVGLGWFLIPLGWGVLNPGNGLGILICLLLTAGALLWDAIRLKCGESRAFRSLFLVISCILCAGAAWSAAMTLCMMSASRSEPPKGSTVVVLGCMVNGTVPSADLQSRIDTAAAYLKDHPDSSCVASGGTGSGESISEAEAIRRSLVGSGIDDSRIFLESESRTTMENLAGTMRLIRTKGLSGKIALVTDEYHEFRACRIARKAGAEPYPVSAETPWYIFSACWAREVLALTKYLLFPS